MFSSNTSQVSSDANYIEDVFSTWLYTGNGSTQTITNGIDLAGKGGLVWIKSRSNGLNNVLSMTGLPSNNWLETNTENPVGTAALFTGFTSTGFGLTTSGGAATNSNDFAQNLFTSWSFARQAKFFDVVTFTGNNTANQAVPHNLGSVPGFIVIRKTSGSGMWPTYHRSLGRNYFQRLNSTTAGTTVTNIWGTADPTSTDFYVSNVTNPGTGNPFVESGQQYIAMVFAHNAGGFGLTGTDNVISCGSFVAEPGTGNFTVNLGYEPQWILYKRSDSTSNWVIVDNMRGMPVTASALQNQLFPNTSGAEVAGSTMVPTATGFQQSGGGGFIGGATYIYIAIRRGPMKTPTTGTSVFTPYLVPASPTTGAITGFVTDAGFIGSRAGSDKFAWGARLMGNPTLNSTNTNAESANSNQIWDRMNGWWNTAINNYMTWGFARAPGYMDVVCYTGTGSARTVTHNLGVAPELMIVKSRSSGALDWLVYSNPTGNANALLLNTTDASFGSSAWNSTTPTASVFSTGATSGTNNSGATFVAYLFASCPGVSKVGSYTGNGGAAGGAGTAQTINCGFSAGSRFVLVKCTSNTGEWFVFDSARGIVAGNDPYLQMQSSAVELTGSDALDTDSSGFIVNQIAATDLNVTGRTYIFLAIA